MLTAYLPTETGLAPGPPPATDEVRVEGAEAAATAGQAAWYDLREPSAEEVVALERIVGVPLPSRHTMHEIEQSSRLYAHGSSAYLTVLVMCSAEGERPRTTPISFVLTDGTLVTLRYDDPQSVRSFIRHAAVGGPLLHGGAGVLVGLLEAVVDRAADILEGVGEEVTRLSEHVFRPSEEGEAGSDPADLERTVRRIGRLAHTAGLAENSLASLARGITYLALILDRVDASRELKQRAKTLGRDIQSLREYVTDLSGKLGFLLDATLGLIDLQQTKVMKVFTMLALAFMPPTLIAGIYGMNFAHMPELGWPWGYPFALAVMIVSAIVPYWVFRRRGWL